MVGAEGATREMDKVAEYTEEEEEEEEEEDKDKEEELS
jgi:hypothetical protein